MSKEYKPKKPKVRYEDEILYHAGTEELTASLQHKFVRYFKDARGKTFEVGSGKGVMLTLFKQERIPAYGIDLSPSSVEYCRSKGLEGHNADLLSHLKKISSSSLGGIEFIRESHRTLLPSAKFLLVTPNAKDLRTTERFWLDVTHVRPYPEKLLRFLLEKEGFSKVSCTTGPEPAGNILIRIAKAFLRAWFMGFMFTGDLVVLAEK